MEGVRSTRATDPAHSLLGCRSVTNLSVTDITSAEQAQHLVQYAMSQRTVGATLMNDRSSRRQVKHPLNAIS